MELIRCPRCAREIPDSSKFCRRCGCAIAWRRQPAAAAAAAVVSPPPRSPAREPEPIRRSGGAGIFAIFAASGLFFFVNYHVAVRPVMSPATPSIAPPYTPPPMIFRSSGFRSASNVLPPAPPPAPPGTTMWLEDPAPGTWDAYDRTRRAPQYAYPPAGNRRH